MTLTWNWRRDTWASMGTYDLDLSNPHDRSEPQRLRLSGARATWAVNDTGSFSGECRSSDLVALGRLPDPGRPWLSWAAGPFAWGGPLTAVNDDLGSGTTEVVGRAWDWLLDGRRAPKAGQQGGASAGAVLARAIADRNRGSDPLGLTVVADQTGPAFPRNARGEDLRALLQQAARDGLVEYRIDHATRTLEIRRRVGRDRAHEVVLTWGRQVVGGRRGLDRESIVTELLAVPAIEPYARTRSVSVRDEAAVAAHGLRQRTVVFPAAVSRATLRPLAEAALGQLSGHGGTLQLDLANVGRCFEAFTEGDTVTVVLPPINLRARLRVMVRAYDTESGLLTVSGDILEGVS
jgi:hypothetical protein